MRIGLIVYGDLNIISGGYLYDRKLVETFKAYGDEVEVISLPRRNYGSHLYDNMSRSLLRRLLKVQVDVLLQDELNHPSLFWLNRRLKDRINFPLISIVHHLRSSEFRPRWQNKFYGWIERSYLRSVHGFIFNSQITRQKAVLLNCGIKQKPFVIANPAGDRLNAYINEGEIIQRAGISGPLRLLFLGNVIPRKGLLILIKAFNKLPEGLCTLTVVGNTEVDKTYYAKVIKYAKSANLYTKIHFMGILDESELALQLRRSHVMVVPSEYEGFGIVYLEGMGFGLPSIATTNGGAVEIVTHGENGYLIRPGNENALVEHIKKLAEDRQLLLKLSLAARQRFLIQPGWAQTGENVRNFLLQLVSLPQNGYPKYGKV